MSTKNLPEPVKPHDNASIDGVAAELSAEALHNLTGWFDVLIQMDLAQKQRNEQRSKDEKIGLQNNSSNPTKSN